MNQTENFQSGHIYTVEIWVEAKDGYALPANPRDFRMWWLLSTATLSVMTLDLTEPSGKSNPFADIKADSYYYDAVLWAVENGITGGTSANTFSPDNNCTRAQVVTFLYRFINAE